VTSADSRLLFAPYRAPELGPHHLAQLPFPHTPLVGERVDEQQPAPALVTVPRLVDVRDTATAVVHLDTQHMAVVPQEQPELAPRRHPVHQRVGRQLAYAQQHIAAALGFGESPLGEERVSEAPGGGNGPAFAPEELLTRVHGTRVA